MGVTFATDNFAVFVYCNIAVVNLSYMPYFSAGNQQDATSASCGPVATWSVPLLHQSDCPSLSRRPSCRVRLSHRFNTSTYPTPPFSRVVVDLQGFSSSEGEIVTFVL